MLWHCNIIIFMKLLNCLQTLILGPDYYFLFPCGDFSCPVPSNPGHRGHVQVAGRRLLRVLDAPRDAGLGCWSGRIREGSQKEADLWLDGGEGSLSACLPAYYIFLPFFAEFAHFFGKNMKKCRKFWEYTALRQLSGIPHNSGKPWWNFQLKIFDGFSEFNGIL